MPGTIVVAEASKTVRRMVEIALDRHPFGLEFTESADAALAAVRERAPAVAIIDAQLPGDGYEVARQIKADGATRGTKVLLLVGRNHSFDATRGRQAGVDGHLTKPFMTQQLVEHVFQAVGEPTPDGDLFKTGLNIPLARKPKSDPAKAEPPPPPPAISAPAAPEPPPAAAPPAAQAGAANPFANVQSPFDADEPTRQYEKTPSAEPPSPAPPSSAPADDAPAAAAVAQVSAAAAAGDLGAILQGASREVVERIAWEVIPPLAEALLKEEIARVVRERLA